MSARDAMLDAEFVRATPGLRPFSVGVLTLCRQLGLKIAMGASEGDGYRELLTIAWLLDERHAIEEVKTFAALPADRRAGVIDRYEFEIAPAFLLAVKAEIARTNRAVEAATAYTIEAKPDGRAGPVPVGK